MPQELEGLRLVLAKEESKVMDAERKLVEGWSQQRSSAMKRQQNAMETGRKWAKASGKSIKSS